MAMTKKERAEFDAAIANAETVGALRWTIPVKKDLPQPKNHGDQISGWEINSYIPEVYQAWSQTSGHGTGPKRGNSASQGGVSLFSTRLLALRALRHEAELLAAKNLRYIDKMIEGEIASSLLPTQTRETV